RQFIATGVEVKIVELPGLPPKGDVSDWIAAGGTREQLEALIEAEPAVDASDLIDEDSERAAPADDATAASRGPMIDAGEQDLAHIADAAWAALTTANEPPVVFRFAGGMVRTVPDEHGALVPE